MFGNDWAARGGMIRPIALAGFWSLIIVIPLVIILQYAVFKPMDDHWAQIDAQSKLKTQQEHAKLVSMDCKQLGDWLLQDNVWDHDNLIWAQNHYLVSEIAL